MTAIAALEALGFVMAVTTLAVLLRPRAARTRTPTDLLLFAFLLAVQAIVHVGDLGEWSGITELDRVGDALRVGVPLTWLLALFTLRQEGLSDELRDEREQLAFLLSEAPLTACVFDEGGAVVAISRDWATRAGSAAQAIVGTPFAGSAAFPAELVTAVERALATNGEYASSEQPLHALWGGRDQWLLWYASIRPSGRGRPRRVTLIVHVVTAQHERELRARLDATRLFEEHRLGTVAELAVTVAHDLNNYLHVIAANAEFLALGSQARESAEATEAIRVATARSTDLVQSLNGLARARGRVAPLNLSDLVRSTATLVERTLPSAIQLRIEIADAAAWVVGDASRLQQAVLNLLVNARDAMPEGGLLEVAVHDLGDDVRVRVRDTGTGIAPDIQPRIFERFFTTKAAHNGTGLGLALVNAVVSEHGGHIDLDSRFGAGTTFDLVLPKIRHESGLVELPPSPSRRTAG